MLNCLSYLPRASSMRQSSCAQHSNQCLFGGNPAVIRAQLRYHQPQICGDVKPRSLATRGALNEAVNGNYTI